MNDVIKKMQRLAMAAMLAGLSATVYGYYQAGAEQFYQSYLMGFLFVLAFSSGSLGFLMIHHLVMSRWGLILQRPLEAGARTFALVAVLFVPLLGGLPELYSWDRHEALHDQVLRNKLFWLNENAFCARSVLYFVVLIGLALLLSRWSRQQDEQPERALVLGSRMRKLSGVGLILYALAVTFAAFDWIMSIEPKWYSTIFGALVLVSHGLGALCLMAIMAHRLRGVAPIDRLATPRQFQDIGNLIFAFTILWAYISIGQYIVIWSANLPEEVEYYLHRAHGGWPELAGLITILLFFIPFMVMLFKNNKKKSAVLAGIALYLLLVRPLDLVWMVAPVFRPDFHLHGLDLAAIAGLTGLWLLFFLQELAARPLVPLNDPRFQHMLAQPEGKEEG